MVRVNYYRPGDSLLRPRTRAFVTAIAGAGTPEAKVVGGTTELSLRDEMREVLRIRVPRK